MEDILKFLLVIGFLAFSFFKQAKKETASEQKGEGDPIPMPEETCDDPILEVSPSPKMRQEEVQKSKRYKKQSLHPEPPKAVSMPTPKTSQEEPDYSIHSAEEARKAIIWSEILHRKYE